MRKKMSKLKAIVKKVRVIILLAFLLFAVIAINPNPWQEGVAIRGVEKNSSAYLAGIENPSPNSPPRSREVIRSMNDMPIRNEADYYEFIQGLEPNQTIRITTNRDTYRLTARPELAVTVLNETEQKIVEELIQENRTVNGTVITENRTVQKYVDVPKTETEVIGTQDIGLSIYEAPTTNIRKGLDLQGGTRVILAPENKITSQEMNVVISNLKERLNTYGLSDIIVKEVGDLEGNSYILVEIAGANEEEVKDLISRQGKFEAKIDNETVFRGGDDIKSVSTTGTRAGLDPQGYGRYQEGWTCRFYFVITLSPNAAERQAEATKDLDVITENGESYLSKKLELYLDNNLVDALNIQADLKGKEITEPQITGGGSGKTKQEAEQDCLKSMKRLQTILITGSLPVKLEVVQTEGVSPVLGKEFVKNAILIALVAIAAVAIVIFIRFRRWEVSVPVTFTMLSEIILMLGFAALVGWNIDIAAIAGIIVAAGTGVDDQIVIADEVLRGKTDVTYNWKQKLKKAFFIIMGAYITTMVAMAPLLVAGAGMVRGFALTTMAGVTFGVFVTRPAFAAIIEQLLKK
ncbi:hypothetical protein GF345_01995 [Candidatus Woesearchaeota archaeon]|nr:hypothetical protein [Candidatus Woesearchaeota archaeon]